MTLGEYAFAGDCFCGLDLPNLTAPTNVVLTAELDVIPRYDVKLESQPRYVTTLENGLVAQEL